MRHAQVLNALAVIIGIFALTMFVPSAVSWYYHDGAERAPSATASCWSS